MKFLEYIVERARTLRPPKVRRMEKRFEIFGQEVIISGTGNFLSSARSGAYHEEIFDAFAALVRPDSICVDVGANLGITSVALAQLARAGRVVAIEADLRTYEFLRRNVEAFDGIVALHCLVGNEDSDKTYLFNASDPGCSTSTSPERAVAMVKFGLEPIQMRSVTLDHIVADLSLARVDLIKIDVEGGELDVLAGARDTLARFKPVVIMEFNAHCLMNFARINPPDALDRIMGLFPHVRRIGQRNGKTVFEPIENFDFMTQHVLHRNCVDNLVCCFDAEVLGII